MQGGYRKIKPVYITHSKASGHFTSDPGPLLKILIRVKVQCQLRPSLNVLSQLQPLPCLEQVTAEDGTDHGDFLPCYCVKKYDVAKLTQHYPYLSQLLLIKKMVGN